VTEESGSDEGVDHESPQGGRAPQTASAEEIKAYIARLMATRPEPTPSQIQTVRDLLPPVQDTASV
jgi:hypothetical protein